MINLALCGILSQDGDPAKKLADDYSAYVISQGGVVDYTRVYAMYKDEYLTDVDKDKMIDWYDFRAGIKFSSGVIISNIYSLITPYRTNTNITANISLVDNSYMAGTGAGGVGALLINDTANIVGSLNGRWREELKIYNSNNTQTHYPVIYQYLTVDTAHSIALYQTTNKLYCYTRSADSTTYTNIPTPVLTDRMVILNRTLDWGDLNRHTTFVEGLTIIVALPSDKLGMGVDRMELRSKPQVPFYYHKLYTL